MTVWKTVPEHCVVCIGSRETSVPKVAVGPPDDLCPFYVLYQIWLEPDWLFSNHRHIYSAKQSATFWRHHRAVLFNHRLDVTTDASHPGPSRRPHVPHTSRWEDFYPKHTLLKVHHHDHHHHHHHHHYWDFYGVKITKIIALSQLKKQYSKSDDKVRIWQVKKKWLKTLSEYCEQWYWPVGSTAQLAAAHCPTLDFVPAVLSYSRPNYAPASRTMAFTPQCSPAVTHYFSSEYTRY